MTPSDPAVRGRPGFDRADSQERDPLNHSAREAKRWLLQACDDLDFVRWIRGERVFYDKGCFLAHQAGEKALQACLYGLGRRRVIGHSLLEFVQELAAEAPSFSSVLDPARRLDRFYVSAL